MVERKKGTKGFNLRAKTITVHKLSDFDLRGGENCMLKKGLKSNFKSKAEFEVDDGIVNKGFESKTNFKNQFNVKGKKKTDSQTATDDRPERFGRNKFQDKKTDSDKLQRFGRNKFQDKKKTDSATATDDRPQRFGRNKFQDKKTDSDKLERFGRNKFQSKKKTDSATATDDRPQKRKKRVIRLNPYDITNKRMDDVIPTITERTIEKKEEPEENKAVDISMNAQFRAIQPSPSILSFVEENLLGRRREIEFKRAGYNTEILYPLDNIPLYTKSERARIEETVFRNYLTFYAAAKVSSSLPPPDVPEIAFAGRSNVGKSSILNALTRQWGVVRISDKPGLTQGINFFQLGPKVSLVDLPGYGFAYAKKETKEAWEELVKEYVSTRVGLKRVCLLIDTKWGMKPRDHELIDLMERSQTKYQVVLTKTDLVFPIDVARRAMQIEEELKGNKSIVQPLMMVSSRTGAGIRCLRTALAKIARFAKL